jgi:PKD repeat protein
MRYKSSLLPVYAVISIIILIGLASATLSIGNPSHSIEKKCGVSQNIRGWINISAANETADAIIRDSLNNNISLINLLKQNPNLRYSCIPKNCEKGYIESNGGTEKNLAGHQSVFYGMVFSGMLLSINSISFNISASGIQASCNNQLEIDFFDDGTIDFSNVKADTSTCPQTRNYGCYMPSVPQDEYEISSSPYCEKINLSKAPGFRIGAWVKKISGNKNITMLIYDAYGNSIDNANCRLPDASTQGGEVYCDVNYNVKNKEEYYVCISSDEGTGEYKIKGYAATNGCGFYGEPPRNENAAYYIFAEAKKFGAFQDIKVLDELETEEELSHLTMQYILDKYGNLDCTKTCIVPIKFTTNINQNQDFDLIIKNIEIKQEKASGITTENKLYDMAETSAKVDSDFGKMYLDNSGLKVKNYAGSFKYKLFAGDKEIFSETLSVLKAPIIKGLVPLKTAYAFPTKFELSVDAPENVSRYEWDFGDNSTDTTNVKTITHTYDEPGNYLLKASIKDINNITSSKTFEVNVSSPKDLISNLLTEMKDNLDNIQNQINTYDLFYRARLNELINVNNLSLKIKAIEEQYNSSDETEYEGIISEMLNLKIPEALINSKTAQNYIFYPKTENIDIDVLKNITPGNYDESDASYQEAIASWNIGNIKNNLTFREISARYFETSEPILKVFNFKIQEKNTLGYNSYFIIKDMENLKFREDYGEVEVGGYKYIKLAGGAKEIVFSTSEDVSFENVPAFVAPPLNKLSLEEYGEPKVDEPIFPWGTFAIAILILLAVGIAVYMILQRWYKKRYEDYLFRNKTDLYNLFHYIETQKRKGVSEGEIHNKLKKAGWSSEQIKYSMKKRAGKRTGMLEIPIIKIFQKN